MLSDPVRGSTRRLPPPYAPSSVQSSRATSCETAGRRVLCRSIASTQAWPSRTRSCMTMCPPTSRSPAASSPSSRYNQPAGASISSSSSSHAHGTQHAQNEDCAAVCSDAPWTAWTGSIKSVAPGGWTSAVKSPSPTSASNAGRAETKRDARARQCPPAQRAPNESAARPHVGESEPAAM